MLFRFMDLKTLEKERDGFALELVPTIIKVAVALVVPLLLVFVIRKYIDIHVLILLAISFLISWVYIFFLYRKIIERVRKNKEMITDLKQEQDN